MKMKLLLLFGQKKYKTVFDCSMNAAVETVLQNQASQDITELTNTIPLYFFFFVKVILTTFAICHLCGKNKNQLNYTGNH